MKMPDKKYWGVFGVGFLWGIVITFIVGILYLRNSLVYETQCTSGFDKTVSGISERVKEMKGWTVKTVPCALPLTSDKCKMRVFKLCNAEYAGQMLNNPHDRRVSAVIPCTFAVYEKPDGGTYLARMNVGLLGFILGGEPGRIFPSKIALEQKNMLKGIAE